MLYVAFDYREFLRPQPLYLCGDISCARGICRERTRRRDKRRMLPIQFCHVHDMCLDLLAQRFDVIYGFPLLPMPFPDPFRPEKDAKDEQEYREPFSLHEHHRFSSLKGNI